MTVSTTNTTNNATGDGVTLTFPFTFDLLEASDVVVYVNTVLQTPGTAYTVTPAGGFYPCVGGNVVFTSGFVPPNMSMILIVRQLTLTQLTALPIEGSFSAPTFENVFDRATMQIQQLQTEINNALQLAITTMSGVSTILPAPVAGDLLGWNSTANAITNYSPQQIAAAASGASVFGPSTSTLYGTPYWNNTLGTLLADGGVGTAMQVWTSNGPGVPPSWQNTGAATGVPYGTVVAWWATDPTIPTGWGLCNGQTLTWLTGPHAGNPITLPNLIGMFIEGGDITGGSSTANASGFGSHTNQSVRGQTTHTHTYSGTTGVESTDTGNFLGNLAPQVYAGVNHTHNFSGTTAGGTSEPATYVMVYIMKL